MLKVFSLIVVFALVTVAALHFQTLSGKVSENVEYYSTSDVGAFQVGRFLEKNFPDPQVQGVVTEKPGHWLAMYSNKTIITQTDPLVDLSYTANSILDMSYEIMHPLTMVKVYEARSNASEESFLRVNTLWHRIAFLPVEDSYFSYQDKSGNLIKYPFSTLSRSVTMDNMNPNSVTVTYYNDLFEVNELINFENDAYPVNVTWEVSAFQGELNNGVLYLSQYFEPRFFFNKVNFPGVLNWSNPVIDPSKEDPGNWAITYFSRDNLTDGLCVDFYAEPNRTAYALQFLDLPDWGIVGALGNGRVDVLHWEYHFSSVTIEPVSVRYRTLAFSLESYPQLSNPRTMDSLFTLRLPEPIDIECRNFVSLISENNVGFIVWDAKQFDPKILSSGCVQLVYQNDKYIVLQIKDRLSSSLSNG